MAYRYEGTVRRVVDGDTVDLTLTLARFAFFGGVPIEGEAVQDLGFHLRLVAAPEGLELRGLFRFRLLGFNAPELRGPERPLGQQAKDATRTLLGEATRVVVKTYKGDAFGRWLADVSVAGADVVTLLLEGGWGVAWDGKGKRPGFDVEECYPLRRGTDGPPEP